MQIFSGKILRKFYRQNIGGNSAFTILTAALFFIHAKKRKSTQDTQIGHNSRQIFASKELCPKCSKKSGQIIFGTAVW